MTAAPQHPRRLHTIEEYLDIERRSQEKYEFRDGEVVNLSELVSMAGGAPKHSLIACNLIRELGNLVKGRPCRVYGNDLRVRIPRKTLWAHPDVAVVCGEPQQDVHGSDDHTLTNPLVIAEVLSPSTEAYDRGDKFERYREIESLREYVLVSQHLPRVETFLRQEDGIWLFGSVAGLEPAARFGSLGVELPMREIYAGVEFVPLAEPPSA